MTEEGSGQTVVLQDTQQLPHGHEGSLAGTSEADLQGWSTRVEDLVDRGDEKGAIELLEKVVGSLQIRDDAGSNLSLAAALNDLGHIYAAQGLSLKSDEILNSALLIKQKRAQEGDSWSDDLSQRRTQNDTNVHFPSQSISNTSSMDKHDQLQSKRDYLEEPSTAGRTEEEGWEALTDELSLPLKLSSPAPNKEAHSNGKSVSKQRGRGSFTYGGTGMYSDSLDMTAAEYDQGDSGSHNDHLLDGGASHVLVLAFSHKTKTKDLENLVKPYSNGNCSVRWIDDTRALVVFSTPAMARDALVGIKDPRYKVSVFLEGNEIYGQTSLRDLAPPGPRPATTPRVAERMIARALNSQGVGQALTAKSKGSSLETQKQEIRRKERLHSRAQLRDEAWGSDEEW